MFVSGSDQNRSARPQTNGRTSGQSREGQRREEVDSGAAEGEDPSEVEGRHLGRSSRCNIQVSLQKKTK